MALDKSEIAHIAMLARIRMKDEELATLSNELSQIIDWVEALGEVDTDGVAPMTGVGSFGLPQRADEVSDGGYPDRVTANAPQRAGDYFAVPKVIE